jgi:hypothetical protein
LANKKYVNYTSPKGVACFPALVKPDTKGEYATGGYKTDVEITAAEYKVEKVKLDKIGKELGVKKQPHPVIFEGDPSKERTKGRFYIRTKSMKRPKFWDASGKKQIDPDKDKDFWVRGGSVIKVATGAYINKKGGLSLGLNSVQIIELAEGSNGFDAEEGYSYEGPSNASEAGQSFDSSGGDDSGDADDAEI